MTKTESGVDIRWSLLGLKTLILENAMFRVIVLPQVGGRIYSIIYKPMDRELLWQNPRIDPRQLPFGSPYDDVWCGGWEEMFPNDAAGEILGDNYCDHGEVWSIEWEWEVPNKDLSVVSLRCTAPVSGITFKKTITLDENRADLQVNYQLTNPTRQHFPFIFKLHTAFATRPGNLLLYPSGTRMRLEPEFLGTLSGAQDGFQWPEVEFETASVDLSRVPSVESGQVYFLYGTESPEGWCGIEDRERGLVSRLHYDRSFFPSCWLFASFGGWRNYNVAVFEPATGFPFQIERAIKRGQASKIAPGETISTTVHFTAVEESRRD